MILIIGLSSWAQYQVCAGCRQRTDTAAATCLLPDIIHLSFSEVCIYLDISKIVVKVLRLCFIWCNWGFVKLFSLCFWVQQRHYLQLSRIHIGIHKLWVEDQQNIHKNIKAVYNRRTFSFKYFLKLLKLMHFQAVAEASSEHHPINPPAVENYTF